MMSHMRLHVHEFGPSAGRTVVALHGIRGSGRLFGPIADRLPDLRVVAPDLRGYGASGKAPPWDLSVQVRDVRETLDRLGISQAPLIGFSLGGRIAVEVVAAERSRVERLVLLDPALYVGPVRAAKVAEDALVDEAFASVDEAIEKRIGSGIAPYAPRAYWELWADQLAQGPDGRWRQALSRAAVIALSGEMATPPPPFERLRLPTLLVLGAESDMVAAKQVERYKYELGDFLDVVTVKARHNVVADAADEVAAAIKDFLAR
jgi:lipase